MRLYRGAREQLGTGGKLVLQQMWLWRECRWVGVQIHVS